MKSGYNSRDPASYHVELGLCLEVCRQVRASPRTLLNAVNAAASEAASLEAAVETANQGAAVGADDCGTARNKLASMYVLSSSTSLDTPGQLAAAELQPLLRISSAGRRRPEPSLQPCTLLPAQPASATHPSQSAVSNTTWPGRTLHGATPHVPCVTSAGSHLMPQVLCTSLAPEKSDPGHRSRGWRGGGREVLGLEKSDPGQKRTDKGDTPVAPSLASRRPEVGTQPGAVCEQGGGCVSSRQPKGRPGPAEPAIDKGDPPPAPARARPGSTRPSSASVQYSKQGVLVPLATLSGTCLQAMQVGPGPSAGQQQGEKPGQVRRSPGGEQREVGTDTPPAVSLVRLGPGPGPYPRLQAPQGLGRGSESVSESRGQAGSERRAGPGPGPRPRSGVLQRRAGPGATGSVSAAATGWVAGLEPGSLSSYPGPGLRAPQQLASKPVVQLQAPSHQHLGAGQQGGVGGQPGQMPKRVLAASGPGQAGQGGATGRRPTSAPAPLVLEEPSPALPRPRTAHSGPLHACTSPLAATAVAAAMASPAAAVAGPAAATPLASGGGAVASPGLGAVPVGISGLRRSVSEGRIMGSSSCCKAEQPCNTAQQQPGNCNRRSEQHCSRGQQQQQLCGSDSSGSTVMEAGPQDSCLSKGAVGGPQPATAHLASADVAPPPQASQPLAGAMPAVVLRVEPDPALPDHRIPDPLPGQSPAGGPTSLLPHNQQQLVQQRQSKQQEPQAQQQGVGQQQVAEVPQGPGQQQGAKQPQGGGEQQQGQQQQQQQQQELPDQAGLEREAQAQEAAPGGVSAALSEPDWVVLSPSSKAPLHSLLKEVVPGASPRSRASPHTTRQAAGPAAGQGPGRGTPSGASRGSLGLRAKLAGGRGLLPAGQPGPWGAAGQPLTQHPGSAPAAVPNPGSAASLSSSHPFATKAGAEAGPWMEAGPGVEPGVQLLHSLFQNLHRASVTVSLTGRSAPGPATAAAGQGPRPGPSSRAHSLTGAVPGSTGDPGSVTSAMASSTLGSSMLAPPPCDTPLGEPDPADSASPDTVAGAGTAHQAPPPASRSYPMAATYSETPRVHPLELVPLPAPSIPTPPLPVSAPPTAPAPATSCSAPSPHSLPHAPLPDATSAAALPTGPPADALPPNPGGKGDLEGCSLTGGAASRPGRGAEGERGRLLGDGQQQAEQEQQQRQASQQPRQQPPDPCEPSPAGDTEETKGHEAVAKGPQGEAKAHKGKAKGHEGKAKGRIKAESGDQTSLAGEGRAGQAAEPGPAPPPMSGQESPEPQPPQPAPPPPHNTPYQMLRGTEPTPACQPPPLPLTTHPTPASPLATPFPPTHSPLAGPSRPAEQPEPPLQPAPPALWPLTLRQPAREAVLGQGPPSGVGLVSGAGEQVEQPGGAAAGTGARGGAGAGVAADPAPAAVVAPPQPASAQPHGTRSSAGPPPGTLGPPPPPFTSQQHTTAQGAATAPPTPPAPDHPAGLQPLLPALMPLAATPASKPDQPSSLPDQPSPLTEAQALQGKSVGCLARGQEAGWRPTKTSTSLLAPPVSLPAPEASQAPAPLPTGTGAVALEAEATQAAGPRPLCCGVAALQVAGVAAGVAGAQQAANPTAKGLQTGIVTEVGTTLGNGGEAGSKEKAGSKGEAGSKEKAGSKGEVGSKEKAGSKGEAGSAPGVVCRSRSSGTGSKGRASRAAAAAPGLRIIVPPCDPMLTLHHNPHQQQQLQEHQQPLHHQQHQQQAVGCQAAQPDAASSPCSSTDRLSHPSRLTQGQQGPAGAAAHPVGAGAAAVGAGGQACSTNCPVSSKRPAQAATSAAQVLEPSLVSNHPVAASTQLHPGPLLQLDLQFTLLDSSPGTGSSGRSGGPARAGGDGGLTGEVAGRPAAARQEAPSLTRPARRSGDQILPVASQASQPLSQPQPESGCHNSSAWLGFEPATRLQEVGLACLLSSSSGRAGDAQRTGSLIAGLLGGVAELASLCGLDDGWVVQLVQGHPSHTPSRGG